MVKNKNILSRRLDNLRKAVFTGRTQKSWEAKREYMIKERIR